MKLLHFTDKTELRELLNDLIDKNELNLAGLSAFKEIITNDELLLLYFENKLSLSMCIEFSERGLSEFVI